jgi:hypothetical protein
LIHTADNMIRAEEALDTIGNAAEQAHDPAGEKSYSFGLDAICRVLNLDHEELVSGSKRSSVKNIRKGVIQADAEHGASYGIGFITGYICALRVQQDEGDEA